MHPKPEGVVHERESGTRKVTVEKVTLRHARFRVIYQQRPSHGSRFVTLSPDYLDDQEDAIKRANAWVDRNA